MIKSLLNTVSMQEDFRDVTGDKNGINRNQVTLKTQVDNLSPYEYHTDTRGGNNEVNINQMGTIDTLKDRILGHLAKQCKVPNCK